MLDLSMHVSFLSPHLFIQNKPAEGKDSFL